MKSIEPSINMYYKSLQTSVCSKINELQSKTDTLANSADPEETARNEPSLQDLHCLPFCFLPQTESPICINTRVQGRNSPL